VTEVHTADMIVLLASLLLLLLTPRTGGDQVHRMFTRQNCC
jgi:hypothetical protein